MLNIQLGTRKGDDLMKIVVLDGFTVNPGDLSWDGLRTLGECIIHERTAVEETANRCAGAEAVLTNKVLLDKTTIDALPKLKYIGVLATGYNVVDLEAAREQGITVCNVPAYSTTSVAQATFALILELTNRVALHGESVKSGDWCRSLDFSYWKHPLLELGGSTLGIVGFGAIGGKVAKLADAFGMQLVVHTAHPEKYRADHPSVRFLDLDAVFAESDVVSLHCPLTAGNEKLVNASRLRLMRKTAFLINTARGGLIDEPALADALNTEKIAGAALDVLSTEPPSPDNPLLKAKNCLITPHIAWASKAARQRLLDTAVANVAAYLNGTPQNVIR
jgi:glycerate dehydrogenase